MARGAPALPEVAAPGLRAVRGRAQRAGAQLRLQLPRGHRRGGAALGQRAQQKVGRAVVRCQQHALAAAQRRQRRERRRALVGQLRAPGTGYSTAQGRPDTVLSQLTPQTQQGPGTAGACQRMG